MKRITYLAAAGALVATSGLGAWAANAATSDDPAAHVQTTHRHGADDPVGHRHHRHHGADDPAGHHRGAAAATQARHSSHNEPGDDNGGQGELEPGDDNGGQGELEPGDDNGGANEPGDDNGGANEPGDDNGGANEPGDDHGAANEPG